MTAYIEVLTEGASDVPVIKEVLSRHFSLVEGENFRIHPHRGRGNLPENILASPDIRHQGLLDQLPAKLRGFSWLPENSLVLVLIDSDNDEPSEIISDLEEMLAALPRKPPRVIFRVATEETESWFLADLKAIKASYPNAAVNKLKDIKPDSIIGAWERLAECLGFKVRDISGADKTKWAEKIAPNMDLVNPNSPSLRKMLEGVASYLREIKN